MVSGSTVETYAHAARVPERNKPASNPFTGIVPECRLWRAAKPGPRRGAVQRPTLNNQAASKMLGLQPPYCPPPPYHPPAPLHGYRSGSATAVHNGASSRVTNPPPHANSCGFGERRKGQVSLRRPCCSACGLSRCWSLSVSYERALPSGMEPRMHSPQVWNHACTPLRYGTTHAAARPVQSGAPSGHRRAACR